MENNTLENVLRDMAQKEYLEVTSELLNDLIFEALLSLKQRMVNPERLTVYRGVDDTPLFSIRIPGEEGTFQVSWQIPHKLISSLKYVRIPKNDETGLSRRFAVAAVRNQTQRFIWSLITTFSQAAVDTVSIAENLDEIQKARHPFPPEDGDDPCSLEFLIKERAAVFAKNSQHNAKKIFTRAAQSLPPDDPEKRVLFAYLHRIRLKVWQEAKKAYTKTKHLDNWCDVIASDHRFQDLPKDLLQKFGERGDSSPYDLALLDVARECEIGAVSRSTLIGYLQQSKKWLEETPPQTIDDLLSAYSFPKEFKPDIIDMIPNPEM